VPGGGAVTLTPHERGLSDALAAAASARLPGAEGGGGQTAATERAGAYGMALSR
jgi:hypothetical protein